MAALVGVIISLGAVAQAQDSGALVDALVKKGVLSDQEAEEIRADLLKDFSQTAAGKLDMASSTKGLKLYGDARVRYTTEQAYNRNGNGNTATNREQLRYRLRIGGEYTLVDSFKAGVQLATGAASNDSTNATFDDAFQRNATTDTMTVDLVYLEWNPASISDMDIKVVAGRHKKTFDLDWINWDGDANPEGFGQKVSYKINDNFTIGWNGGQYMYEDSSNNSGTTTAADNTHDDTWMFANQFVLEYKYNKDLSFKVAPMMWNMYGHTPGAGAGESAGSALDVEGNDGMLQIPVEAKWKSWGVPTKFLYTYGHNFDASAKNAANQDLIRKDSVDQSIADQNESHVFGLELGELKKKKDWMAAMHYIHREAFSSNLDLVDSDWALQRSNMKGYAFKAGYLFTDAVGMNVSYLIGDTLKDNIYPGTGTFDGQIADRSRVEVLQVDLTWKF